MKQAHFLISLAIESGRPVDPDKFVQSARVNVADRPEVWHIANGLVAATNTITTPDAIGVWIFGKLWRHDAHMGRLRDISPDMAETISRSLGASLMSDCWGSYVALIERDGRHYLLRDPSGAMPCYYIVRDGHLIISSSIGAIEDLVGSLHPNAAAIARFLAAKDLRHSETCLADVRELRRGSRMHVNERIITLDQLWNPWSFAMAAPATIPVGVAADLEKVVIQCTRAQAEEYSHVLLGVSGGLDSSVVAASLAEANVGVTCLTIATEDASGDERSYARALCSHLELPLEERFEQLATIDIMTTHASHLPRPIARLFAQSGNRIQEDLADLVGADVFFHGGGGDNVFCYLNSAAPIADQILSKHPGLETIKVGSDIARMNGTGLVEALWKGFRRAWLRPPAYRWPLDFTLLNRAARELADGAGDHPWLLVPAGGLPGRAAHIAWLLGIENHLEGFQRELRRPVIAPLMSQPIVEFCLGLPTWAWSQGGRNRAVAREAFRQRLPSSIQNRRTKGTPGPFAMQIFEAKRKAIRNFLLDGALAKLGLLDKPALEQAIAWRGPVPELMNTRILQLVDVEAWLRHWTSR